jgi:glycosyltransferase involved in cell wall biosynthesis
VNVLHIVPAFFGPDGVLGGAERYALELARHMAAAVPTRLLTFGDVPRLDHTDGLRVRVAGPARYIRGQRSNPFSPALFGEIRWADVVHCHQQHVLASSTAAAVSRVTGRRVFVTDLGGGGWDASAYVSTDRWYHGHLHLSEYSRRVAGQDGKPWAHVISGGVDTSRFSPSPSPRRDGSVVFVGRLLPHKGVEVLIDAVPADMHLKVIGQPMDERYLAHLHVRAAGKHVSFHHDYGDDAIVSSYRSAACVVLPSVYRNVYGAETKVPELLGQTLLEAMACGTPVIASNVASLPEVVDDTVCGFLVPPNDPGALRERLLWIRSHPAPASAMGDAGRARVLARFTWDSVVRRCLAHYQTAA